VPLVCADPDVLQEVFHHLVDNALKFHRPGVPPVIQIHSRGKLANGVVRFSVQDNGQGIAPEHTDRVFNVFERLHTGAEYPGTGIGLAIVHKALQRMGGRISVESTPGLGSTFHVELPAAD
jgi:signal transduction histidine kinase